MLCPLPILLPDLLSWVRGDIDCWSKAEELICARDFIIICLAPCLRRQELLARPHTAQLANF